MNANPLYVSLPTQLSQLLDNQAFLFTFTKFTTCIRDMLLLALRTVEGRAN